MGAAGDGLIVVLGDHSAVLSSFSERVRALGYRTLRAKSFHDAIDVASDRELRFAAALVDPRVPTASLAQSLEALRRQTRSEELVCLAAGDKPETTICDRLREAGIQLALWEPASDHALRFQLNRATANWDPARLRGEIRTPVDWVTRVSARGREKPVRIYTFSGSGAYLATRRPSLSGADLTVELPLPDGRVKLEAQVVYTNVPGNRRRRNLPDGMAVRFTNTPAQTGRAIRECVRAEAAELVV